jgi:hypothetical protein
MISDLKRVGTDSGRAWRARVALGVGLLLASACVSKPTAPAAPPPFDHLRVASTFHTYRSPVATGLPTSVVQDEGGRYLLCDHANVYLLTLTSAGLDAVLLARPQVPVWLPTGLAYRAGLLYVANDRGHDVLVLRRTDAGLSLVRRITSPRMVQPRNVAAEQDGSVAVADQDGAVLKFGPGGALRWRTPLEGAHGVTESGGSIYASSLGRQTVSRLDQSGAVLQSAGSPGTSLGRYLYPVSLAAADGRILVTDGHNGRITVLDERLHVVDHAGASGPGLDAFNIPFATLPLADGYLVADSFKSRLLRLDRRWTIQYQVALGPSVPAGRERPLVFGSDARPYTYDMLPGVDVTARLGLRSPLRFEGSFNGLDHVNPDGTSTHLVFEDPQLGSTGPTWAQQVGQYIVVGSSANGQLEVIDPTSGMFTYVRVGGDAWWRAGTLLQSGGVRRDLAEVIAPALPAFARARQLLDRGVSRPDAFNQALAAGKPRDWSADLTSPAGQQFLHSAMTPNDARQYFDWALKQPQQRAVEQLEVRYLSGS